MCLKRHAVTCLTILCLSSVSYCQLTFYTLNTSDRPDPDGLVSFESNPSNPMYQGLGQMDVAPTGGNYLDFSDSGRLFANVGGNTILELDPSNGSTIGSLSTSITGGIEGLAVGSNDLIYVHFENVGHILEVDYDNGTEQLITTVGFDIDQLDFDLDGNLIAFDTNQSGNIYSIPLDGSPSTIIANLPHSTVTSVAFDPIDGDLFRLGGRDAVGQRELWKLEWSNGQPVGQDQYIMDFTNSGSHAGLAVIPEPTSITLFTLSALTLLSRRKRT